jgi:hypothetical protein
MQVPGLALRAAALEPMAKSRCRGQRGRGAGLLSSRQDVEGGECCCAGLGGERVSVGQRRAVSPVLLASAARMARARWWGAPWQRPQPGREAQAAAPTTRCT